MNVLMYSKLTIGSNGEVNSGESWRHIVSNERTNTANRGVISDTLARNE